MEKLSRIRFPLYPVPADRIIRRGDASIAFYRGNDMEFYLDDKSIPYDNLGRRRLELRKHHRMMRLRKGIKTYLGLIKSPYKYFIDYNGKVFHYKKERRLNLKYYKIDTWNKYPNGEVLLNIKGIHCPISTIYEPTAKYVGLLYFPVGGYVFYDYSDDTELIANERLYRYI